MGEEENLTMPLAHGRVVVIRQAINGWIIELDGRSRVTITWQEAMILLKDILTTIG